jgi:hypothetical protein
VRWRDEQGFVGGFEALPFGFLVFVAGSLLLANAWAVFDCHLAASAAAREAVRSFVESSDPGSAQLDAEAAAGEALAGHGKDPERMTLDWRGDVLQRCQPVTAIVTYRVPTVAVPWIGAFGGGILRTSARHTEIVDPYRDGLDVDGFRPEACRG